MNTFNLWVLKRGVKRDTNFLNLAVFTEKATHAAASDTRRLSHMFSANRTLQSGPNIAAVGDVVLRDRVLLRQTP